MAGEMNRRRFLRTFGKGAVVLLGAACAPAQPSPTAAPPEPAKDKPAEKAAEQPAAKPGEAAPAKAAAAQGDRLVVALAQWGIETPFAWRSAQLDKALWDTCHDPLIMRDPKTYEFRPGLATSWANSPDYKTWTFKLRQGVKFHGDWGELTAEDVKFTVEQNLKPDAQGGSAPFFRAQLEKVEAPDPYTVVLTFKNPTWEVPTHFAQMTGYQNITSKRYLETVGEEKAAQNPIGTGPYRHVEGQQGTLHRFEAVPNHWRVTPAYKELIIRRVPDQATRVSGLRAGEIDIASVTGDFIDQAKQAGLRIHASENAAQHWIVLPGNTTADKEDHCPTCAWVGDPSDPKSLENATKVRLALNLAVNKKAIYDTIFRGYGSDTPFSYWYYPFHKGHSQEWKIPPYDPQRAKQLLAEAGHPNGFEIKMHLVPQNADALDLVEAVALDWEKVGIKVRRIQEDLGSWLPKNRARKTGISGFSYAPPSAIDEPSLSWQRTIWTKGTFYLLAEGTFDKPLEAILAETDPEKRTRMTVELGQQLYDGHYGVMIGMKAATWAVSKRVGAWPTLAYAALENNYEYITT